MTRLAQARPSLPIVSPAFGIALICPFSSLARSRKRVNSYTLAHSGGMVLYSRAKLLCRISCVESAMRLPVLWCWMWRGGWRSREGRGREAKADCTPFCCQRQPMWLPHARRSASQAFNKAVWPDRGSERVASVLFFPPLSLSSSDFCNYQNPL